jgi:hypothetical protein
VFLLRTLVPGILVAGILAVRAQAATVEVYRAQTIHRVHRGTVPLPQKLLKNLSRDGFSRGTTLSTNAGTLLAGNGSRFTTGSATVFIGTGSNLAANGSIDSNATQVFINGRVSTGATSRKTGALQIASATAGPLTLSSTSVTKISSSSEPTGTSISLTSATFQLDLITAFGEGNPDSAVNDGPSAGGNFGTLPEYDAAKHSQIFTFSAEESVLPFAPVPEPATWIGAFLTLAAVGYHQRKRIVPGYRSGAKI